MWFVGEFQREGEPIIEPIIYLYIYTHTHTYTGAWSLWVWRVDWCQKSENFGEFY